MKKRKPIYILFIMIAFCISCKGQTKKDIAEEGRGVETKSEIIAQEPANITRTIKQGQNGDMWLAAFDGVFRYDGSSFTNITDSVSSSRFFSILEDKKGSFWFGSIGSGAYYYDGKTVQNFTTEDGLIDNSIVCIYEDQIDNIWFGANGGASRYDGKFFKNYRIGEGTMMEEGSENFSLNLTTKESSSTAVNEVNAIIEDKAGKMWLGTRGDLFVYDGVGFVNLTDDHKAFKNTRWIIEDQAGHIWFGGTNGLWRYDGSTFTKITRNFTGYIYEDRHGNIWTSSQSTESNNWMLSRYDAKTLYDKNPTAHIIESKYEDNRGMIFGIAEAPDGSIWFGGLDGVYRYDGMVVSKVGGKD